MARKKDIKDFEVPRPDEEVLEAEREDKKSTNTAFILMFPALILAVIAAYCAKSVAVSLLAVALALYEFIMTKKFIQDYYKNR